MNWLSINNLSFGYGKKDIFKNLNLFVGSKKGNVTVIMGTSGSGKSSLIKLMLGILKPKKGNISYFKENLVLGYLPQNPIIFEHLNTLQNARYFETTSVYKNRFDEPLFLELKDILGLDKILENPTPMSEISGGQKQRICLLRELSIKPDVVHLDEPTSGIDPAVRLNFLITLKKISKKFNIKIVYVTHDKIEAELIADNIIYLESLPDGIVNPHSYEINKFINHPPCLQALEAFAYPTSNILNLQQSELEKLKINSLKSLDSFYVNIKQENVCLDSFGFEYSLLYENDIYYRIKIENTIKELTLLKSKIKLDNNLKIRFTGDMDFYSKEGKFTETINANEK